MSGTDIKNRIDRITTARQVRINRLEAIRSNKPSYDIQTGIEINTANRRPEAAITPACQV
jgi:hypothetical protein